MSENTGFHPENPLIMQWGRVKLVRQDGEFVLISETAHELGKKLQAYGLSVGSDLLFAGPESLLAADHG